MFFRRTIYGSSLTVFILICEGLTQNYSYVNKSKNSSDKIAFSKDHEKLVAFNLNGLTNSSRRMIIDKITSKCWHNYSVPCLVLDLSYLIDKLEQTKSFQIFPGITLIYNNNNTTSSVVRSNSFNNTDMNMNVYLLQKFTKYFSSLSVRVNLFDNPIVQTVKEFATNTVRTFFNGPLEETGRGTKTGKKDQSVMWTLALMIALSISAIVALAGKALIAGTIALILSLICLLKGCGGGHKAAHYEIITKPAHVHDVDHLGLTGSITNSAYGGYARNLIQDRIIPALNLIDNDSYGDKEIVHEVPVRIPLHAYHLSPHYGQSAVVDRDNIEN